MEPVTPTAPAPPVAPTRGLRLNTRWLKGDTYTSIAKKFHVTTKAIKEANPGVDPTSFEDWSVLHIPAPAAPAVSGERVRNARLAGARTQVYAVKSGDTLIGIAGPIRRHCQSVCARPTTSPPTGLKSARNSIFRPRRRAPCGSDADRAEFKHPAADTVPTGAAPSVSEARFWVAGVLGPARDQDLNRIGVETGRHRPGVLCCSPAGAGLRDALQLQHGPAGASPGDQQLIWCGLGFGLCAAAALMDYRQLKKSGG